LLQVKPQLVPSQVVLAPLAGKGQGVQLVKPQVSTDEFDTHMPEQLCCMASQAGVMSGSAWSATDRSSGGVVPFW
jgi:hypothetical protein